MGLAERKEREKNELRELILIKAKEIISKEGQDKLSIRRIATEIEYSPATIYLYFQDKDEILYQMMNKGFEILAHQMQDVYLEKSALRRLLLIGQSYIRFGIENQDWYTLMFNSVSPMNHIERCKSEWGHGIAILALQMWSTVHGLVSLSNTQRLTIVDGNCTMGMDCPLIDLTLENMMFTLFNYKI